MKDKTNYLYPQLLRVLALMRLNRRVPVGTHGGVRGRLSIYESLLLDFICEILCRLLQDYDLSQRFLGTPLKISIMR